MTPWNFRVTDYYPPPPQWWLFLQFARRRFKLPAWTIRVRKNKRHFFPQHFLGEARKSSQHKFGHKKCHWNHVLHQLIPIHDLISSKGNFYFILIFFNQQAFRLHFPTSKATLYAKSVPSFQQISSSQLHTERIHSSPLNCLYLSAWRVSRSRLRVRR